MRLSAGILNIIWVFFLMILVLVGVATQQPTQ